MFDIPLDESVRVLKRVLPLMSQRRVPTIPQNYAVWYDYVTRGNEQLHIEMSGLLSRGQQLSPELCRRLYEKYFVDETNTGVDDIQGAVRSALESVFHQLDGLGGDIAAFDGVLARSAESLSGELSQEDLHNLLGNLEVETRRTQSRSREVEGSLHQMASEMQELRSQVDQLSQETLTDALTGVANRRAFDEAMEHMVAESERTRMSLSLILVDIDHFKAFNDRHGHLVGDKVLRFVAQEMVQCVKGRDLLARYGGEEFGILLPATRLEGAVALAKSICAVVESHPPKDAAGEVIDRVTISLGVASYLAGESFDDFIGRADACLFASKEAGRNLVTSQLHARGRARWAK